MAHERAAWCDELGRIDPAQLIFVDESGVDTQMTRRFARAPRGQRACGAVPWGRWRRLTLIGALGLGGLAAVMSVAAPTSTAVFHAFVEQVLAPALRERPGARIVMDHLAPHKASRVSASLRAAGLESRLLPFTGALLRLTATALSNESARAALLAGPQPDRTVLVQNQNRAPRHRRPQS